MKKWKVFISSTYTDLYTYRQEILNLFHSRLADRFELSRPMEYMTDQGDFETNLEKSIDGVKKSDIVLSIIGERAGSIPQGESRTYTEIEYDTALAHNKRVFVFRLLLPNQEINPLFNTISTKHKDINIHDFRDIEGLKLKILECLVPLMTEGSKINPYKGLRSYNVEDGGTFFGRDREVDEMLRRIIGSNQNQLISVIGNSGIGKSSFVKAGVMYRLKNDSALGYSDYHQVVLVPGSVPMQNLEYELRVNSIAENASVESLGEKKLILYIDQFEEIITQVNTQEAEAERTQFIQLLEELLVSAPAKNVLILVSYRSEYISDISNFIVIRESIDYKLPSLDYTIHEGNWEETITQIIEGPAKVQGVFFDQSLVRGLLNDLKDVEGSLPILQFALQQLWTDDTVKDNLIQFSDYQALSGGKGIAGMIAAHADRVVNRITSNGRNQLKESILKSILVNLVEVSQSQNDVKRTVEKKDLFSRLSVFGTNEVASVFSELETDGRLLSITSDKEDKIWVTFVHEALIREWEKLKGWIAERRQALREQQRLEGDVIQNKEQVRNWYKGRDLRKARHWVKKHPDLASSSLISFLKKSKRKVIYRRLSVLSLMLVLAVGGYFGNIRLQAYLFVHDIPLLNHQAGIKEFPDAYLQFVSGRMNLDSVWYLYLNNSNNYRDLKYFKNLEIISINQVSLSIQNLDELFRNCPQVSDVHLTSLNRITDLSSLKYLEKLELLVIDGLPLRDLAGLPNEGLKKLTLKNLKALNSLSGLPKTSLEYLTIDDLGVGGHDIIAGLPKTGLKGLYIDNILSIDSLVGLPEAGIKELNLSSLLNLKSLDGLPRKGLENLELSGLSNLKTLEGLPEEGLKNLRLGSLSNLESLEGLPEEGLEILELNRLSNLETLEGLPEEGLEILELNRLSNLESLDGLPNMGLKSLSISRLDKLESLDGLPNMGLKSLSISGLPNLKRLDGIPYEGLENLRLSRLDKLESLDGLPKTGLKNLFLFGLSNLESLNGLPEEDLEDLTLMSLINLESLVGLPEKSLRKLNISGLKFLSLDGLPRKGLENLELSGLSNLKTLEGLPEEGLKNLRLGSLSNLEKVLMVYLERA